MQDFEILAGVIEEVTGVTKENLISKRRFREWVDLRTICAVLLKKHNPVLSLVSIGNLMNIDHSTVCHSRHAHHYAMEEKNGHAKYIQLYEKINYTFLEKIIVEKDETYENLFLLRDRLQRDLLRVNQEIAEIEGLRNRINRNKK